MVYGQVSRHSPGSNNAFSIYLAINRKSEQFSGLLRTELCLNGVCGFRDPRIMKDSLIPRRAFIDDGDRDKRAIIMGRLQ